MLGQESSTSQAAAGHHLPHCSVEGCGAPLHPERTPGTGFSAECERNQTILAASLFSISHNSPPNAQQLRLGDRLLVQTRSANRVLETMLHLGMHEPGAGNAAMSAESPAPIEQCSIQQCTVG